MVIYFQKRTYDGVFCLKFGTAYDCERRARRMKRRCKLYHLISQKKTRVRYKEFWDADKRCIRPVRNRECVADEYFRKIREFAGERFIILFLPRITTQVFQKKHLPVSHCINCAFCDCTKDVRNVNN